MSVADEVRELREEVARLAASFTQTQRERINARESLPEKLDPTPVELPVGHERPPSTRELVQQYIREELSQAASEDDMGTFEEEDDFEPEDEELLSLSGFEVSEFEMVDEIPIEDAAPPPEAPEEPSSEAEATPAET